MDRRSYLGSVTAAIAGCAAFEGEPVSISGIDGHVETIASRLEIPWGAAFHGGTLYLTERPGRIVRVPNVADGSGGEPAVVVDLTNETEAIGEGGLLGLAFGPEGERAYSYQTYRSENGIANRVRRHDPSEGFRSEVLLDGIPGAAIHDGGRLAIEGGALFVTTGDARRAEGAQRPSTLSGKVLRLTPDGNPHPENPFGNAVFTYGHRNPQGLAFRESRLYSTEHGPDHDDEINLLEAGENYGWPAVMGMSDDGDRNGEGRGDDGSDGGNGTDGESNGDAFVNPLATYTPTIAPGSATFYQGPIGEWRGDFFFGTLAGEHLHRVRIDAREVDAQERLLEGEFGRLRTAFIGPDDHLYVTTSNRDGRGSPAETDDRVLRIEPE